MTTSEKVALVTGSGQRIGAAIVQGLHSRGMKVAIHYRNSRIDALSLQHKLNEVRPNSATVFQADLLDKKSTSKLGERVVNELGRLDALVNNASLFRSETNILSSVENFEELAGIHVLAPYILTLSVLPELRKSKGCVVNVTDIYAQRPKKHLALYSATKAALESLTKSMALEFAPDVRVNAVAPGAILWPKDEPAEKDIIGRTPLKRLGNIDDVAKAIEYLVFDATFTTGQILTIDGGRTINKP